jgi:hypothetical protein
MNRVIVPARQATEAGGIHSLESIPGPHKHLKIRALLTDHLTPQPISAGKFRASRVTGKSLLTLNEDKKIKK